MENYFDPILENPLDDEMEGLISMIGERRYLKSLVEKFKIGMSSNPDDLTEHECRKVIRGIMRNTADYSGHEMRQ